jgi:hypothetical protein
MATIIVVGVVFFNIGFLAGVWWGTGWARRRMTSLEAELQKLRHHQSRKKAV